MADNVILNPGVGGETVATDDVGGVQHQKVKIEFGDDGVATMVSATNPLPVQFDIGDLATVVQQNQQTEYLLTLADGVISGLYQTQIITSVLPDGAATEDTQLANNLCLNTLKDAVSGTEMQVDVVASLPAGTNNIGDVDVLTLPAIPTGDNTIGRVKLTDGTDVADVLDLPNSNPLTVAIVDTNGDQLSSFGGGTQYTEDAAAAANPVGTAVNLIRQDTPAGLTTNDGDNVAQRGTNFGAGFVQVLTSAGAFVDTFGGGQQYSDGDAEADPTGTVAMGTDGSNIFALHTDTAGDLQVDVLSSALPTGAATAANQTTGNTSLATIAGAVSGTEMQVDVLTSALPTGASTLAEQQTQTTALQLIDDTVVTMGTDTYTEATSKGLNITAVRRDADTTLVGTTNEFGPLQMDANGRLKVEVFSGETLPVSLTSTTITGTVAVTQSGTWDEVGINDSGNSITVDAPVGTPVNVQIGNATLSAGVIDETGASAVDALAIGGGTAHDAVDSGNPIKIGGVAVSGSASPTSVASGDRTRFIANQHGIPYMMGGHPNLITREYDFGTAAQTDVNLAAATVAADERVYVTRLEVLCDNANSVAVSARVGFGTASVPAASSTGVSGMIASHPGIAAGSGIICGNGSGIIAVGAAGEEPRITTSAATSGNTHVIISYYLIDETP